MAVLMAKKIHKSFFLEKQETVVLKGIDFVLKANETVAITGASGAGKSTLLHVLSTLEPPSAGELWWKNHQVALHKLRGKALAHFRNRSIGFVFQFHHLLGEFSALENVMMPALIAGMKRKQAMEEAKTLLDFVGLMHRFRHLPSELSGGEKQRVAIARAVILRPKILFADEPTGNLDSDNAHRVMDLLLQVQKQTHATFVLVTHEPYWAKKMKRVVHMQDGMLLT